MYINNTFHKEIQLQAGQDSRTQPEDGFPDTAGRTSKFTGEQRGLLAAVCELNYQKKLPNVISNESI